MEQIALLLCNPSMTVSFESIAWTEGGRHQLLLLLLESFSFVIVDRELCLGSLSYLTIAAATDVS